jgi:hypothetical protein
MPFSLYSRASSIFLALPATDNVLDPPFAAVVAEVAAVIAVFDVSNLRFYTYLILNNIL